MIMRKNKLKALAGFGLAAALSAASMSVSAGVGEGLVLYQSYCAVCHGAEAEGQAMGKSLVDTSAKELDGPQLLDVIENGRPGTGMRAWGDSFTEVEIMDIANYIRGIQGKGLIVIELEDAIGNDPVALAGRELFNGAANCSSCHTVGDAGGQVGPVLDGVFDRLGEQGILEALQSPSSTIVEGFAGVVVEQKDGTVIRGRARNETDAYVQVQSADGLRWRTYFKDRVKSVTASDVSVMPEIYAGLSAQQKEQILAYLRSL